MNGFIVDVFTNQRFKGNRAGVLVVEDDFPDESLMQNIAFELGCSETAFVKQLSETEFSIRYFTPNSEIEFCGHATIGAFELMRHRYGLLAGEYSLYTQSNQYSVELTAETTLFELDDCRVIKELTQNQADELYAAFASSAPEAQPEDLDVVIVHSGLSDILLPVKTLEQLNALVMDRDRVVALSEKYSVVGVHAYTTCSKLYTAHCRNFAPLYAIDEEAATGTSNAGLTTYLAANGYVLEMETNSILQGEAMANPCTITTILTSSSSVKVGGSAVVSMSFTLL